MSEMLSAKSENHNKEIVDKTHTGVGKIVLDLAIDLATGEEKRFQ